MAKIVVVEDDPMISDIYQKKFADSGFEVKAASSGDEVLAIAKREKVDIVLLDLVMPKMDGFEVIKNLRKGSYDSNIRIIAFSNLSQKEDRDRAMKLGADSFMVKSDYAPSDLVKEVNRLMNQWEQERKNEARLDDLANGSDDNKESLDKSGLAKKILMIEDEEVFLDMFGGKLRQDGYDVTTVQNGAWGLKEALKGGYDLIVIDMVMPAMMGDEVIAKLKLDEKTAKVPIIVLSASVDSDMQRKMEEAGVEAFYIKTQLIPSELSKKVAEFIGE